jgi:hypothetical protein
VEEHDRMDLKGTEWGHVDWSCLAHHEFRVKWLAVINIVADF